MKAIGYQKNAACPLSEAGKSKGKAKGKSFCQDFKG
jgi:hypothetical protein